ncbi:tyrosine-type recombinase/integrase [Scytonema sp. NUACC21]
MNVRVNEKGQGIIHITKGKGDKERHIVIALELMTDLLSSRTTNKPNEPLFKNCYGSCLSDRYIREIVKQACVRAGIKKPVSPHWLRHCHATHSQKRGAPQFLTQKTMGHASPVQLSKYSHVDPDDSSGLYLPR